MGLLLEVISVNTYGLVVGASVIIILSYLCNLIAKKTNIPSVLLLILIGILIKLAIDYVGLPWLDGDTEALVLETLGTVGLIFIVLEAALDLELSKEKWPIIWKSIVVALFALLLSSFAIAAFLNWLVLDDFYTSLVYAIPLSIMSSAIIIPSVVDLKEDSKEFMIYESTFSDILGIMFFYLLLGNAETSSTSAVIGNVGVNIGVTILLSLVMSYGLTYLLQRITGHLKLFLIISVLLLLYALGKMAHLSPLVLILIFGLMLNNHKVFWRGKLGGVIDDSKLKSITHEFHLITLETAFVIRTFFFVIFGVTIVLSALLDMNVLFISTVIILLLYLVRYILLRIFNKKNIFPLLYIAPRGLITILLFFQIQGAYSEYYSEDFNSAILLFVIIASSIIMTVALIQNGMDPNFSAAELSEEDFEEIIEGEEDVQNLEESLEGASNDGTESGDAQENHSSESEQKKPPLDQDPEGVE